MSGSGPSRPRLSALARAGRDPGDRRLPGEAGQQRLPGSSRHRRLARRRRILVSRESRPMARLDVPRLAPVGLSRGPSRRLPHLPLRWRRVLEAPAQVEVPMPPPVEPAPSPVESAMHRILVADDDPHIREVICFALEKAGMATVAAADGAEALRASSASTPDLVVLDIGMPEMDGLEVCRLLRKTSDVPVLFLSARDEEIDRILGLEIGGDDYVTKPFSPRELVARVNAILRRMRAAPADDGAAAAARAWRPQARSGQPRGRLRRTAAGADGDRVRDPHAPDARPEMCSAATRSWTPPTPPTSTSPTAPSTATSATSAPSSPPPAAGRDRDRARRRLQARRVRRVSAARNGGRASRSSCWPSC